MRLFGISVILLQMQNVFSMRKIDANSREWSDIIFEGRNKKYGAYRLRVNTPHRLLKAFIIAFIILVLPFFIFFLIVLLPIGEKFNPLKMKDESHLVPLQDKINLSAIDTRLSRRLNRVLGKPPKSSAVPVVKVDVTVILDDSLSGKSGRISDLLAGSGVRDTSMFRKTMPDIENITGAKELRIVAQLPEFPGGATAFMKWLTTNLRYPSIEQRAKRQGTVKVQFIVDADGSIKDIKIITSAGRYFDQEVMRLMKTMPAWKPGIDKGKPAMTKVGIPIVFKL